MPGTRLVEHVREHRQGPPLNPRPCGHDLGVAHEEMRDRARPPVQPTSKATPRTCCARGATERPFEVYLDGLVSGRADVIYDEHDGRVGRLAIIGNKTARVDQVESWQLQIDVDAGRREGQEVAASSSTTSAPSGATTWT